MFFFRVVRPTSTLSLKVLDHSVLRTTHKLLGEAKFNLIDILRQHNGKISNVSLHLDLKQGNSKTGTLVIKMNGLRIDMNQPSLRLPLPKPATQTPVLTPGTASTSASSVSAQEPVVVVSVSFCRT